MGRKLPISGIMVAPKSSQKFEVTDAGVSQFSMKFVNDYGGHPELKFRCEGTTCKALPPPSRANQEGA
jgi:P pilus assembly chaperone PapD